MKRYDHCVIGKFPLNILYFQNKTKLHFDNHSLIISSQCHIRTYKLPFWKWFNGKYPCSTNHTDYKLAIKACSIQQSLTFDELYLALDFYSDTSHLPHTSLISNMYGTIALNMSVWKKVFHNTDGVCYTFHSNYYWTR